MFSQVTEVRRRRGATSELVGYRMRESTALTDLLQVELDISSSLHAEGNRGKLSLDVQMGAVSH